MTETEMSEKIDAALAEQVAAEEERKKRLPVSIRIGPGGSLQNAGQEAAISALKRLGYRWYPLKDDPTSRAQFGALAIACMQSKMPLLQVLEKLGDVDPLLRSLLGDEIKDDDLPRLNLRQAWRPGADAGVIPPLPIDPVTGERIRNPWLPLDPIEIKGSGQDKRLRPMPHFDHGSQAMIKEKSPRLAAWLEACAKNGGQPSMKMLDELEAERMEAEYLRKIEFGAEQWAANKLRRDSGANLTERNLFARSIADPWLLRAHRAEAKAGAPTLRFQNFTVANAIAKRDPQVREVHKQAEQIFKAWQQEGKQQAA
jgi:hypothetical protein